MCSYFKDTYDVQVKNADCTPRKLQSLGWHHKTEIDEGIHHLYEWF